MTETTIPKPEMHFTYQTKNLVNGKTYVGVHSTEDLEDGYLGSGVVLQKAIDKYGADNFRLIPLCFFDTKQEAFDEEEIIVDEAWVKSNDNYNLALGGKGGRLFKETLPYIEAQKTSKGGTIDGVYYPSIRYASRKLNKSKDWIRNRFYGYNTPEELKLKKQKLHGHRWMFRGVEYLSLRDAERRTGVSRYLIRKEGVRYE